MLETKVQNAEIPAPNYDLELLVQNYYLGATLVVQSRSAPDMQAQELFEKGRALIEQCKRIEASAGFRAKVPGDPVDPATRPVMPGGNRA